MHRHLRVDASRARNEQKEDNVYIVQRTDHVDVPLAGTAPWKKMIDEMCSTYTGAPSGLNAWLENILSDKKCIVEWILRWEVNVRREIPGVLSEPSMEIVTCKTWYYPDTPTCEMTPEEIATELGPEFVPTDIAELFAQKPEDAPADIELNTEGQ